MREMHELEKTIGYEFKNEGYLRTALTHSSYANEMRSRCPYNERQEFLGDAVLSIIVSDYLFKSSHLAEGDLTKLRASIVCEKSLWGWAKDPPRRLYPAGQGRGELRRTGTPLHPGRCL
mgnify:CR=1 FL=1